MTTYTTITNAEIDQDSPITQALATAWRDNTLAIAEGDASAPRIATLAIAPPTAGSNIIFRASVPEVEFTTAVGAHAQVGLSCTVVVAGTVRMAMDGKQSGGSGEVKFLQNGSAVSTQTVSSGVFAELTYDATVAFGDCLSFTFANGSAGTTTAKNFEIRSGSQNLAVV